MNIQTAIVPVAGAGSRVLPLTASIEKCLLPIYAGDQSRPVIDYVVNDLAGAGIQRIIFVVSERGQLQLSEYFEGLNLNLVAQLERLNKHEVIEQELARRQAFNVRFEYIVQPADSPYGTAVPLFMAKDYLQGEAHFAFVTGDDFIYRRNGSSELAAALQDWGDHPTEHLIMGKQVPRDQIPSGLLQTDAAGNLLAIDERPPLERVPAEPVANISRYVFSEAIWPHIDAVMSHDRGSNEHPITDSINAAVTAGQQFRVHPISGEYLDGGSFAGLLRASQYITDHPAQ